MQTEVTRTISIDNSFADAFGEAILLGDAASMAELYQQNKKDFLFFLHQQFLRASRETITLIISILPLKACLEAESDLQLYIRMAPEEESKDQKSERRDKLFWIIAQLELAHLLASKNTKHATEIAAYLNENNFVAYSNVLNQYAKNLSANLVTNATDLKKHAAEEKTYSSIAGSLLIATTAKQRAEILAKLGWEECISVQTQLWRELKNIAKNHTLTNSQMRNLNKIALRIQELEKQKHKKLHPLIEDFAEVELISTMEQLAKYGFAELVTKLSKLLPANSRQEILGELKRTMPLDSASPEIVSSSEGSIPAASSAADDSKATTEDALNVTLAQRSTSTKKT